MKQLNEEDMRYIVDWWLEKYHNTNLDTVEAENPKWKENPQEYSWDFYDKYKVTKEQCDEWETWAKSWVKNKLKISKKLLERSWWNVYLNASPSVINDEINESTNSK